MIICIQYSRIDYKKGNLMENNEYDYFNKNNWKINEDNTKAFKLFNFKSFSEAISWMIEVSMQAEINNHHPEWKNVYNKIEVLLTTHDSGKITKKDYDLATKMDIAFEKYRVK